jgi:aryl-alcohol dehydrogenase-like predicted oxidoreductase
MGMSGMYGQTPRDEAIATIHAAIDAGVNLIDTGDFYGVGHNEALIAEAIRGRRERVVLSVKFGALRSPDGGWTGVDCRPSSVKNSLAYTLQRLGTDHVDIYRPARLDPSVPIEDTVGAISELVDAGFVRHVGLSEVGVHTITRAHAVHPIADVQLEYSLITRTPERAILPALQKLGVGLTAYGVLSRGLLTRSAPSGPADFRVHLPRFDKRYEAGNRAAADRLAQLGAEFGATPAQLAIAWVLSRGPGVVPVVGSRRPAQLREALGALQVRLSAEQLDAIGAAVSPASVAGERYPEAHMRALDSERA